MPNLRDIRKRIASVKGTQKLTRAMKLVSAAKLRKAQENLFRLRPYARRVLETAAVVAARLEEEDHPLLARRKGGKSLILVITSDKGMCGSFNANILRQAEATIAGATPSMVVLAVAGKKGLGHFRTARMKVDRELMGFYEGSAFEKASDLSKWFVDEFESRRVDGVSIIYNEFKSAVAHKVVVEEVLPIRQATLDGALKDADFIFEPDKRGLLDKLLMYVATEIYRAIMESTASEHGARMSAMENATNNADDMIKNLTLEYNKARQSSITKELMEIVGGGEAQRANG